MTIFEVFDKIIEATAPIYGYGEARAIAARLLNDKYGVSAIDVVIDSRRDIAFDLQDIIRLSNSEPVQYVVGFSEFCAHRFKVSKAVLIPRGETEELVGRVLRDLGGGFCGTIVDVGTGSGCIAISLALALPGAKVSAIDISDSALDIAVQNATALCAKVDFQKGDIFTTDSLRYDVVVSNPPYVLQNERRLMQDNVLKWEPDGALFVTDDDPLIYYRAIAERSTECHHIFFEINENLGDRMCNLLIDSGFTDVQVLTDIHSKDRICLAKRG